MEAKPIAELRDPEVVVVPAKLEFDVGFVVLVVFELEGGEESMCEVFVGVVLDIPECTCKSHPCCEVHEVFLNP